MRNLGRKLWRSATLTEWSVKLVGPLRLVLVTPLLLTRFSETEIAAWYLFASVNFVGVIMGGRISLTLSRMISMARGGASDLSPIKKAVGGGDSSPNWEAIIRVFRCMGLLQLLVVFVSVSFASLIGYFTLSNLLTGDPDAQAVWTAFWLMQGSSLLYGCFGHYPITLRGLGHVALVNRWATISALLSVLGGCAILSLNGGIVGLVITMQVLGGLVLFCNWWLIRSVDNGALHHAGRPLWNGQIWKWAWGPLWKGFLAQLSTQGLMQISALIFSIYATTAGLASFLFSLSLMRTLQQFAMTPFSSQQPRFTRLMSSGRLDELRNVMSQRIAISQGLLLLGVLGIGIVGPTLLTLMGSNIQLLGLWAWLALGGVFLYERFNTFNLAVSAVGNNMLMYWHLLASGACTLLMLWFVTPLWGVWGIIAALAVPSAIIMNWQSARLASCQLDCPLPEWFGRIATGKKVCSK